MHFPVPDGAIGTLDRRRADGWYSPGAVETTGKGRRIASPHATRITGKRKVAGRRLTARPPEEYVRPFWPPTEADLRSEEREAVAALNAILGALAQEGEL